MACTQPTSFELAADFGAGALGVRARPARRPRRGGARLQGRASPSPRRQAGLFVNDNIAAAGMMFCAEEEAQGPRDGRGRAALVRGQRGRAVRAVGRARGARLRVLPPARARTRRCSRRRRCKQRLDDGLSLVGTPDKVARGRASLRARSASTSSSASCRSAGSPTTTSATASACSARRSSPQFRPARPRLMAEAPEFALQPLRPGGQGRPVPALRARCGRRAGSSPTRSSPGQFMVPGYDDVVALLTDPTTFSNAAARRRRSRRRPVRRARRCSPPTRPTTSGCAAPCRGRSRPGR